jgi:hypothetical protein
MSDETKAMYDELASFTEEDLLERLGDELPYLGIGRGSRFELISRAKLWREEELPKLARNFCGDPRLKAFRNGKRSDSYELFVVLVDVIGAAHIGVPVATVAFLVIKMGLNAVCEKSTLAQ